MENKILRDYQKNILFDIKNMIKSGERVFFIKASMATGKTFIMSEFAKQYKRDRKCLVVGPKQSLKAFERDFEMDFDFFSYEKLYSIYKNNILDFNSKFLKEYDIIFIDEAHKSGAKLISKPLHAIKDEGNWLYFVGASAHSRRMDQIHTEEDQCDVLFDGNLVGDIGLDYCFQNNILVEPDYYYCESRLNDEIQDLIRKLQSSNIPLTIKLSLIQNLKRVKLDYDNFSSLEKTLNKALNNYKDLDNLKIVIFISRIDKYDDTNELFIKSFKRIFKNREIHSYKYFSNNSKKNLDNFLENDGINILFAVNKANLSLHHQDLKVAILYRNTISPIVYEQQIGRVLFTDQKGCIIDIVNNAHNVKPLQFSGQKAESNFILYRNKDNSRFQDKVALEFDVHYCKYKEILDIIKSKNYSNISYDFKGENNTLGYFCLKYKKVKSDVIYFLTKDIKFERALLAARTEYFFNFNGKSFSAESIGDKFHMDKDEIRYLIKKSKFTPNHDMLEFFKLNDDSYEDIVEEKINELEDILN